MSFIARKVEQKPQLVREYGYKLLIWNNDLYRGGFMHMCGCQIDTSFIYKPTVDCYQAWNSRWLQLLVSSQIRCPES